MRYENKHWVDELTVHSTMSKNAKNIPISNVCLGGCMITLKNKINVFLKKFLHSRSPTSGNLHSKISKNVDLVFEVNSALYCQNGLFSTF